MRQAFPTDRAVRGRFISLLHRMVECLGPVALPFLPASLQALMHRGASEQDLCDVFALLHQLMVRSKS